MTTSASLDANLPLPWWIKRAFLPRRLEQLYQHCNQDDSRPFWRALIERLDVTYTVHGAAHIPSEGATLVVANHPFGLLDAAIVCDLLLQRRSDVQVLTNYLIAAIPKLRPICLSVDPFGGPRARTRNRQALRRAGEHLQQQGMLVIFPAGEVAAWQPRRGAVVEAPWTATAARLARHHQAAVLPLFVAGRNSPLFHMLGVVHPRLRTLRLAHELLNKRGAHIDVHAGEPLASPLLASLPDDAITSLLRYLTLHSRNARRKDHRRSSRGEQRQHEGVAADK